MPCYRNVGCGPYEMYSCSECPASKLEYTEQYKQIEDVVKRSIIPSAPIPEGQERDQYIEINGVQFSYKKLAAQLGFVKVDTLKLCQKVPSGTLVAFSSGDEYPGIDIEFVRPNDEVSSAIARAEQPVGEENSPEPLRAFLYDGRETYIAYTKPDIRPNEKSADAPRPITLVASGDPDLHVNVYSENPYVCYKGELH